MSTQKIRVENPPPKMDGENNGSNPMNKWMIWGFYFFLPLLLVQHPPRFSSTPRFILHLFISQLVTTNHHPTKTKPGRKTTASLSPKDSPQRWHGRFERLQDVDEFLGHSVVEGNEVFLRQKSAVFDPGDGAETLKIMAGWCLTLTLLRPFARHLVGKMTIHCSFACH